MTDTVSAPSSVAVLTSGGDAGGMNAAVRSAVRLGLDRGYSVLAVKNGFLGLRNGDIHEMDWMSVSGLVSEGGADIGTNRYVPDGPAIEQIAKQIAAYRIDGLLMAGGWRGWTVPGCADWARELDPTRLENGTPGCVSSN